MFNIIVSLLTKKTMSSITINIKEELLDALRQKADFSNLTIDQLIEKYIEEMLNSPDRTMLMEKATEYVLTKNHELLKRLA